MRTINFFKALLFGLGLIAVIASCEKNDNKTTEVNADVALDEDFVSVMYEEIEDLGDEAVVYYEANQGRMAAPAGGKYMRLGQCVKVTKEWDGATIKVTIDFGETNCTGKDGRERRGKIIIEHSGSYWDNNKTINYSFEDFFVDNNQITGTKVVKRYLNADNHRQSDVTVDGKIILADNEGEITRKAEHTRVVVEGSPTYYKHDDVIELTGNAVTTFPDNTQITCEITSPLVRKHEYGCMRYFVAGTKSIVDREGKTIVIDYGNGECDNLATVTKDGETTTITLKRKRRF